MDNKDPLYSKEQRGYVILLIPRQYLSSYPTQKNPMLASRFHLYSNVLWGQGRVGSGVTIRFLSPQRVIIFSFKRDCPAEVLKARTETQNKTKHPYGINFPRKRDYFFFYSHRIILWSADFHYCNPTPGTLCTKAWYDDSLLEVQFPNFKKFMT